MSNLAISLPPELKRHIASLCSPAELTTLARIHPSYQADAEIILYKNITHHMNHEKTSVIDTLRLNRRKASLVHSLTVEFPLRWNCKDNSSRRAAWYLCDALTNLCALIDLRLHYSREDHLLQGRLEDILSDGIFKLHTLHCSSFLNISKFFSSQSESLQILGLRSYGDPERVLKIYRRVYAALDTSRKPVIFSFERDTYLPVFNVLSVFPTFSNDNAFSWQPIMESYDSDRSCLVVLSKEEVSWVRIYLEDAPEANILTKLLEEMIQNFPDVTNLEIYFRHEAEEAERLISPQVSSILVDSLPSYEWELTFGSW